MPVIHRRVLGRVALGTLPLASILGANSLTAAAQGGASGCPAGKVRAWSEPNFGGTMTELSYIPTGPNCVNQPFRSAANRSSNFLLRLYSAPDCSLDGDIDRASSGEDVADFSAQSYVLEKDTGGGIDEPI